MQQQGSSILRHPTQFLDAERVVKVILAHARFQKPLASYLHGGAGIAEPGPPHQARQNPLQTLEGRLLLASTRYRPKASVQHAACFCNFFFGSCRSGIAFV
jgi:hypothetical protein